MDENEPQADQTPAETPDEPQGDGAPDLQAELEKARAEARKWEDRAKRANGKAVTEAEKRAEEAAGELARVAAERDALAAEKERRDVVGRVAKATGVPEAVVASLSGADEVALSEQARAVLSSMRGYPETRDAGEVSVSLLTADDIRAIKDPAERIRARAAHQELFH